MKQIFDWLREQINRSIYSISLHNNHGVYFKAIDIVDVGNLIDEAEAKWESEHKSYDAEKVVQCIHEYFVQKIDDYEEDIVPHEILEYNKAICEIVRSGGME